MDRPGGLSYWLGGLLHLANLFELLRQGQSWCVRGLLERDGFLSQRHGLVELAELGERESHVHASLRTAPILARGGEQVGDGYGLAAQREGTDDVARGLDRKSTRLNSSHLGISYA